MFSTRTGLTDQQGIDKSESRRHPSTCARLRAVLLTTLVIAIFCGGARLGLAQRIEGDAQGGTAKPRNEQVRSTEGPIFRAGSLMGATVQTKDGQAVGAITDLVLDLDQGRLALVVVNGDKETIGGEGKLGLPLEIFNNVVTTRPPVVDVEMTELRAAPRVGDQSGSVTRKDAAGIFQHFARQPYWLKDPAGATAADKLTLASNLRNTEIHNGKGTLLGHVQDFAATTRGEIAYAGIAQAEEETRLYPVPLSAFVVSADGKNWVLELPKGILEHTPTFSSRDWPKTLDRGWIEYVNVRYGRSAFDGVGHERHGEPVEKGKSAAR